MMAVRLGCLTNASETAVHIHEADPWQEGDPNHLLPAVLRLPPRKEDRAELTHVHSPRGSHCVGTDATW